jgi:magnesium chelatase family protein
MEEGGSGDGETSAAIAARVAAAIDVQQARYQAHQFSRNASIPVGLMERFCVLDATSRTELKAAAESLSFSSRAFHSILRVARTIADLEQSAAIGKEHLLEAIQHRRYCEGDVYWNYK